ncbi:MAG: PQQ-dependent sugar dehydrogenase, partial [Planctomycetota bacterium]
MSFGDFRFGLSLTFRKVLCLSWLFVVAAAPVQSRDAWTTSKVRGVPGTPDAYRVDPVAGEAFERPTAVIAVPGRLELLVVEISGRIYSLSPSGERALVLDLTKPRPGRSSKTRVTLFDATLHPKFPQRPEIYLVYKGPDPQPNTRVSRFSVTTSGALRAARESEKTFISWPSGGHNGSCLRFGPDGSLYVSAGDGAGPNPPDRLKGAQDLTNLWGSIFRIDVDRSENGKPYGIPKDNPFRDLKGARPEIFAYGFRNPWRMAFDRTNGDLWLGDVGWETWEMVHRVVAGGNYGWSVMEGRMPLRSDVTPGPTPIRPPVKDHPRSEANSITGGIVYAGSKYPELQGAFIYGDYVTGRIWSLRARGERYESRELADTPLRIIAFAEGSKGEIYVLDHDYTERLYELTPRPRIDDAPPFPRLLSDTGVFSDTKTLTPATGVVPYDVKAKRWMDGAVASRLLAIPGKAAIETSGSTGGWKFPEGTVFAKTLTHPLAGFRRVETQILHFEEGTWRPYVYAWNSAQTDATLVAASGENRALEGAADGRVWRHVGRAECVLCHNEPGGAVLGFEAIQLDRPLRPSEPTQLTSLFGNGVFDEPVSSEDSEDSRLVDPFDEEASLSVRGRSYLHANCGPCHNRAGDTTISIFFRRHLSLAKIRAFRHPGVGTFGVSDPQIIAPGDPFGSIMLYRMSKIGYARMPHVGSRFVDSRGVALIRDWIHSLGDGKQRDRQTQDQREAVARLVKASAYTSAENAAIAKLLSTSRGALALVQEIHRGTLAAPVRG